MEYHFQLVHQIKETLGEKAIANIEKAIGNPNECVLTIRREDVRKVAEFLKNQRNFRYLMDICGVHYPDREANLEAVYHFYNREQKQRVRLKVPHKEGEKVP